MPKPVQPPEEQVILVKKALETENVFTLSQRLGMHSVTLEKLAQGKPVSRDTVKKAWGIKRRTREDYADVPAFSRKPRSLAVSTSWPLERIRQARDCQLRGDFRLPAELAAAAVSDDAYFTAVHNRTAPIRSLGADLVGVDSGVGQIIKDRCKHSVSVPLSTLVSITRTLVTHGVAVAQIERSSNSDGTQVDFHLTEWPIKWVCWNEHDRRYETQEGENYTRIPINHGDGRWVLFKASDHAPFTYDAAIAPAGLVMASHLGVIKAWNASSSSHGLGRIVGELPENISLQGVSEDQLSPMAHSFLGLLEDMVTGEGSVGIMPSGAKIQFLSNPSNAWQVFSELAVNRKKAMAQIWLGTDGTLGAAGGAPGVDIATLFGVASTKVQGDVECLEKALYSGLYVPWTAINFGDSKNAPRLKFNLPDPDKEKNDKVYAESMERFLETVDRQKKLGFKINETSLRELALKYNVEPPELEPAETKVSRVELAPSDASRVVLVREARISQGLQPFGDERDDLTVFELAEFTEAKKGPDGGGVAPDAAPAAEPPSAAETAAEPLDEQSSPQTAQ